MMDLESYSHSLYQSPTLANVGSLLEKIKVSDQFYKCLILWFYFSQGYESETDDVVD
jgi:hypothetical protein